MKNPSWKRSAATTTVCFAATFGAAQLPAVAAEAAKSAMPKASVAPLLLNGAGVRRDATTALYTADLYLEHKTSNPAEVLRNRGTTQFRMVMLRDTSATQMVDLITQGLVANASEDDLITLVSEVFDVGLMLREQGKLLAGDSLVIDAHPSTGTTLTLRSRAHSEPITQTFANPRLFKAMMGIWLGDHPADPTLKQALLGQPI